MIARNKIQSIVILREGGVSIFAPVHVVNMDSRFRGNNEFKTIV